MRFLKDWQSRASSCNMKHKNLNGRHLPSLKIREEDNRLSTPPVRASIVKLVLTSLLEGSNSGRGRILCVPMAPVVLDICNSIIARARSAVRYSHRYTKWRWSLERETWQITCLIEDLQHGLEDDSARHLLIGGRCSENCTAVSCSMYHALLQKRQPSRPASC